MPSMNSRRPGLVWASPDETEGSERKNALLKAAELAKTPEEKEALEKLANADDSTAPPSKDDEPLPDGVKREADGTFLCEPCEKPIKNAAGLSNHVDSAGHLEKLTAPA